MINVPLDVQRNEDPDLVEIVCILQPSSTIEQSLNVTSSSSSINNNSNDVIPTENGLGTLHLSSTSNEGQNVESNEPSTSSSVGLIVMNTAVSVAGSLVSTIYRLHIC